MAELHIIGELTGGINFNGHQFFCTFEVVHGTQWSPLAGNMQGSTHIMRNAHDGVIWSFPLDIHLSTQAVQGWPKIALQVWSVDEYGRKDLAGYGTCFLPLPSRSGTVEQTIEVPTWKPSYWHSNGFVRLYQQIRQKVMGGNPVLRDDALIHSNDSRFKLHTISAGVVQLRLMVVSRRMAALGIKF